MTWFIIKFCQSLLFVLFVYIFDICFHILYPYQLLDQLFTKQRLCAIEQGTNPFTTPMFFLCKLHTNYISPMLQNILFCNQLPLTDRRFHKKCLVVTKENLGIPVLQS